MDPDEASIPNEFICPILQIPMVDPVITIDGHTFEKRAIEQWFERGNHTNPMTGLHLEMTILIPNLSIKNMIIDFKEKLPSMKKEAQEKEYLKAKVSQLEKRWREDSQKIAKIEKGKENEGDKKDIEKFKKDI